MELKTLLHQLRDPEAALKIRCLLGYQGPLLYVQISLLFIGYLERNIRQILSQCVLRNLLALVDDDMWDSLGTGFMPV